jgi:hypothetical protein
VLRRARDLPGSLRRFPLLGASDTPDTAYVLVTKRLHNQPIHAHRGTHRYYQVISPDNFRNSPPGKPNGTFKTLTTSLTSLRRANQSGVSR